MSTLSIQELRDIPIPTLSTIAGREKVPVEECGEALSSLEALREVGIVLHPEYHIKGYSAAAKDCFVRETVKFKLLDAAARLLPDHCLVILDAWRPIQLQRQIFDEFKTSLRIQFPRASEVELDQKTKVYVSYPSDDRHVPPPHSTGGAVDLTIADRNLAFVEMGTSFDHFGPEAGTRHFEDLFATGHQLSDREYLALKNRRILFHLMAEQGFTNYHEEWWHFDFGDQFWGKITGSPSKYGPIFET